MEFDLFSAQYHFLYRDLSENYLMLRNLLALAQSESALFEF